jgi:DNA mismatch repair protein MutL
MRTRRTGEAIGTELVGEGTGVGPAHDAACPEGTRVEVAELFGAVPARRKFLKSPITEAGHVIAVLERLALARPDVRFSLARDGRPLLLFPPTADARERAIAVLPPAVGERLVPVEADQGSARLRGFVTPTDVARGTTADLYLFVNGRPVRDRYLLHLVGDAYRDALPAGRHPAGVLWLSLDPDEVDVNVHPAKQEVRFRDPGALRRLFSDALRRALGVPERSRAWAQADLAPSVRELPPGGGFAAASASSAEPTHDLFAGADAPLVRPAAFRSLRYLGQALGTYLVLEGPAGLVLLDQHAAHERVLFERLRVDLLAGKLERQALLLPVRVELTRADADLLLARANVLARAGFELEGEGESLRGGLRVALRALPAPLARAPRTNWPLLLEETAAALRDPAARESRDGLEGAFHAAFATAACHAACRKGDRLEPREVEALLVALDEAVWYPNCPHGRPILLHLDAAELERRFLRR